MAKRVDDHDSTMEVSSSQLVSGKEKRPVPHQAPGVGKNDVSMWIGNVVGADDFAGAKKKPPRRRGLVIVLVLVVAAIGGGVGYFLLGRSTPSKPTAGSAAVMVAADARTGPADAAVDAPADASIDAASPPDAAVDAATPTVPAATKPKLTPKKTTKKVVKKPVKKKPATRKK